MGKGDEPNRNEFDSRQIKEHCVPKCANGRVLCDGTLRTMSGGEPSSIK